MLFDFYYAEKWIKETLLICWLGFGFNVIGIHPWSVTSSDLFEQICTTNISWAISERRCFCSKFRNFLTPFAAARFMPKTTIKMAWHEPNDMSTSSATSLIVIRWLSKIIFFTGSMFSSVVDVLEQPGRASLLTSSRPSLKRLYHNWTCVLLIVDVVKRLSQHFKCSCKFKLIFYTQNLIHFLWSIFSNSKKSKSTPNHG